MPRISEFYGIVIRMYHREHEPTHIHAESAGREAVITLDPPRMIRGSLPSHSRQRVLEWTTIHQEELLENWQRARAGMPLIRIPPLGQREIREPLEVWMEKATALRVLQPYVLEVTFSDGTVRRIDLIDDLHGEIFEPLRDPDLFAQAELDPLGGVEWPNGASLAPEFVAAGEPVGAE